MQHNPRSNIIRLYIIKSSKWFLLIMPIIVPFYRHNGLEQFDIMILQSFVYSITIAVLEIPSGYLADVWGRKKTLILGTSLGFTGFFIYCFSHNLEEFIVAELILGVGQSLVSGTDSAMLYDTLFEAGNERKYVKYEGRITAFGNFAESVAGFIGGSILVIISLRTPFYFQTGVAFIAIPAAISLYEPTRHKKLMKFSFGHIFKIVRFSLYENRLLRNTILFSSFIGACTLTMAWYVQPYFILVDLPLPLYGVFWPLLNLSVGIISIYAYKIENKMGKGRSAIIIALFIPLGYILLSQFNAWWAIGFIFFFYFMRGFATPVLKDYINIVTTSNIRATVLSVRNLMIRSFYFMVGMTMGWLTDNAGLQKAFLAGGIIFYVLSIFALILFLRSGKEVKIINFDQ